MARKDIGRLPIYTATEIRMGPQLSKIKNIPILPPVTVDYRNDDTIYSLTAKITCGLNYTGRVDVERSAGAVAGGSPTGNACRFDAECNDCDPCTLDQCGTHTCGGAPTNERAGFPCDPDDNDCGGLCMGGLNDDCPDTTCNFATGTCDDEDALPCTPKKCITDSGCCGDIGIQGSIINGVCNLFACEELTPPKEGGEQCINAAIPDGLFVDGSECDDGLECNGAETCANQQCVAVAPLCGPGGAQAGSEDLVCDEAINSCIAACISNEECDTDGDLICTQDFCDVRLCVGGFNDGNPCANDSDCEKAGGGNDGTCTGGGTGECSIVANICGPGAEDCDPGFCVGGSDFTQGNDCDFDADGDQFCLPGGCDCAPGRCCESDGTCGNLTFRACEAAGGVFFATDDACRTIGTTDTDNICPVYGAGISPEGTLAVALGPITSFNPQGCAGTVLRAGDDFTVGGLAAGEPWVAVEIVRFIASVQVTSRLSIEFWDISNPANPILIEDVFFVGSPGPGGPAIRTLIFDPPLRVPGSGAAIVLTNAVDFTPLGSVSFMATEAAPNFGTNDVNKLFIDGEVVSGGILGVCDGGSRDGLWCDLTKQRAICPGSSCKGGSALGESCTTPADCPDHGCDDAGSCVGDVCEGGSNDGLDCATSSDCPDACVGGPNDGLACSLDEDCTAHSCVGLVCGPNGPNTGQACTTDADCTGDFSCFGECVDIDDVLAVEIVALPTTAPTGACCTAGDGTCVELLPWECREVQGVFQGDGTNCRVCENNIFQGCTDNSNCLACVGGNNHGGTCTLGGSECVSGGGFCAGESVCLPVPPACAAQGCCAKAELLAVPVCVGGFNPGTHCPDGDINCDGTKSFPGTCSGTVDIDPGNCVQIAGACDSLAASGRLIPCTLDSDCPGLCLNSTCPANTNTSGFGSSCAPNCCVQPDVSGGDNCFDAPVAEIPVSTAVSSVTVSGSNKNATFDDWNEGVCVDGDDDGNPCDPQAGDQAAECADPGICTQLCGSGIFNPDGGTRDPGHWEGFHIGECANVRIQTCCSDPIVRPGWAFVSTGCPCATFIGNTGIAPPIGNGVGGPGFARGAPFCDEDNLWQTFSNLPPGTYYYPILSDPDSQCAAPIVGGSGCQYQFSIHAQACLEALCCAEAVCVGGTDVGLPCSLDPVLECPNGSCDDGKCAGGVLHGHDCGLEVDQCPDICEGGACAGDDCATVGCVDLFCHRGPLVGLDCSEDADCGLACLEGPNDGEVCAVDGDCAAECVGGSNNGGACLPATNAGTCTESLDCSNTNILRCNVANGFWAAELNTPDKACDGGDFFGEECESAADCLGVPPGNCVIVGNLQCSGGGGAGACVSGVCCNGPGECKDETIDGPMTRSDCDIIGGDFLGGSRCEYPQPPCPVCTAAEFEENCQPTDSGFIWNIDRNAGGFIPAEDYKPQSPEINQFCFSPCFIQSSGAECSDPNGAVPPPDPATVFVTFRFDGGNDTNPETPPGFPGDPVPNSPGADTPAPVVALAWLGNRCWDYSIVFDSRDPPNDSPLQGFIEGDVYWVEFSGTGSTPDVNGNSCELYMFASNSGNNWAMAENDVWGDRKWDINDLHPWVEGNNDTPQGWGFCIEGGIEVPGDVTGACCTCDGTCEDGVLPRDCLQHISLEGNFPSISNTVGTFFPNQQCPDSVGELPTITCEDVGSGGGCPGEFGERGEDCGNPVVIGGDDPESVPIEPFEFVNFDLNNFCSSTDGLEVYANCGGLTNFGVGKDQWFEFHAPCQGRVNVDICGGAFDSMMAIYTNLTTRAICPNDPDDGQCPPSESQLVYCGDGECAVGDAPTTQVFANDTCLGGTSEGAECETDQDCTGGGVCTGQCFLIRYAGDSGDGGTGKLEMQCQTTNCFPSSAAVQSTLEVVNVGAVVNIKPRMISMAVGDPGQRQAIRVVIEESEEDHLKHLIGQTWYAGPKEAISEQGGSRSPLPAFPNFWASKLQCEPFFEDLHGFCAGGNCAGEECTTVVCFDNTCQRGTVVGDSCTVDADCGLACLNGPDNGVVCAVNGDCALACDGGPNNGDVCVEDSECAKACDGGLNGGVCVGGVCVGGQDDAEVCNDDADCRGAVCVGTGDCGGGFIHVYGEAIVPGMTYTVQVIQEDCDPNDEVSFSPVAVMRTSEFGDLIGSCDVTPCTPAGNGASINDVLASIQRFATQPGAPSKTRAEADPSLIDLVMNITDVLAGVTGFQGLPYFGLRCPTAQLCNGGSNAGGFCETNEDCELLACPEPLSRRTASGR